MKGKGKGREAARNALSDFWSLINKSSNPFFFLIFIVQKMLLPCGLPPEREDD